MHHKVLVKTYSETNDTYDFFHSMDFSIPIEHDLSTEVYCQSFKKEVFLPVHLARLSHSTEPGTIDLLDFDMSYRYHKS